MDVTQSNFEDFYKEIQEYIPKADFYSIDFEMTGIKTSDYEMMTDMPYEKYLKLRSAANKYRIIQVGLCLFFKTGEKEIQARPYNIYIFPREHFRVSPQINVDVSAAEFNTNHNMDWNKWFYEGVTYMSLKQAKKRRADLEKEDKKPKTDLNNLVKLVREDDIQKSEKFVQDLKNWIAENKKEPFIIEEANSFFRKHIYDTLTIDFPNLFYETIIKEESTSKEIHIYNFADETEKKLHEEKKKKEKDDLMWNYVGFTNVVKLLIDSKKPLAGHNCYFDLLFLYSHFIDTLPYSYDDFKKDLHRLFPEIYDTKFIVQYTKFKSKIGQKSHLGFLAESFINSEDPDFHHFKLILEDKFKAYEPGNLENPRYHEAGYDAFLTGVIYAKMFFMLDKEEQERVKNSINTMRCLYSVKLSSEDPFIKEATIYVIKSKDKEEKIASEDILPHFEERKLEDPVRIFTLNGSGFPGSMIIFESQNEEQKKLFVSGIEGLIQKGESILSYEEYCQVRREAYDKGNNKNT